MRVKVVIAIALIIPALSCAHASRQARTMGTIKGIVLDEFDLQPVNGATITIVANARSTTSGPNGTFRLPDLPLGEHTLELGGDAVFAESMPRVPVVGTDSTCVIFFPRTLVSNGKQRDTVANPTAGLLIVNEVPHRFIYFVPSTNFARLQWIRADSAVRLYGPRAARGAMKFTTRPHAPCTMDPRGRVAR